MILNLAARVILGRPLAALAAALLLAACNGGAVAPPPAPTTPVIATPLAVPNPTIDAARAAVATRLAEAGIALEATERAYRPSEPSTLQAARHSVFRIGGADPNQGWVVIYDLGDADAAAQAATEFVRYLQTFGRTSYPGDARFTVNQLGAALVFNWWSRGRATEPELLAAAFELISRIGQRYEVVG